MQQIVPHSLSFGMFLVTLVHDLPSSVETWTRPSSEPAQRTPAFFGDSAIAEMVPSYSTPVLSPWMGPPDHFCLDLSSRVRSGLIFDQVLPSSLERNNTFAAW